MAVVVESGIPLLLAASLRRWRENVNLIFSGCSADGPETGSSGSGKESADPSENTDLSSDDPPDSDPEPSGAAARATIMPGEHR